MNKKLLLISALLLVVSNGWAQGYSYANPFFKYDPFNVSECDVKMLANDPDSECEIADGLIIKEMKHYRWLFFRIRLVSRTNAPQGGDLVLKIKDNDGDTIVRKHISFSLKPEEGIKTTFNAAYNNCLSESISCVLSLENYHQ